MAKIQKVIVHTPDKMDRDHMSEKVNDFYLSVIRRQLRQSNLTAEQKISVIDKVIENLKSRAFGESLNGSK